MWSRSGEPVTWMEHGLPVVSHLTMVTLRLCRCFVRLVEHPEDLGSTPDVARERGAQQQVARQLLNRLIFFDPEVQETCLAEAELIGMMMRNVCAYLQCSHCW